MEACVACLAWKALMRALQRNLGSRHPGDLDKSRASDGSGDSQRDSSSLLGGLHEIASSAFGT